MLESILQLGGSTLGIHRTTVLLVIIPLSLLSTPDSRADWDANGIPVAEHLVYDRVPVRDVDGGVVWAMWTNWKSGAEVTMTKLTKEGNPEWSPSEVLVGFDVGRAVITAVDTGGVVAAWIGGTSPDWGIYAQKVDQNGVAVWGPGGVEVSHGPDCFNPQLAPDGAGGVFLSYSEELPGRTSLYVGRIDAGGSFIWSFDDVIQVGESSLTEIDYKMVPDGLGGVYLAWVGVGLNTNIYATRVTSTGGLPWGFGGVLISQEEGDQDQPDIIAEDSGGAILVWRGDFAGRPRIVAQRVDDDANPLWGSSGVYLCADSLTTSSPQATSDGMGGVIATWSDAREPSGTTVFARAVSPSGHVRWTSSGVRVFAYATGWASYHQVAPDGEGGVVVATMSGDQYGTEIYAQRLNEEGGRLWGNTGKLISGYDDAFTPHIVSMGHYGTVISWSDSRDGDSVLYAQMLTPFGTWGFPYPVITSVSDVPGDQGGQVTLSWNASHYDNWPLDAISHYSVWRSLTSQQLSERGFARQSLIDASQVGPDFQGSGHRIITVEGTQYAWEFVGTHDAHHFESYSYTAPTLFDATAGSPAIHHFLVSAHDGSSSLFYDSEPDSGASQDNLAPTAPEQFVAEATYSPPHLTLSWTPSPDADVAAYVIYRGIVASPGETEIASVTGTSYLDDEWTNANRFYYQLVVRDIHGNESLPISIFPGQMTDSPPANDAPRNSLRQNDPNPFNPRTTIVFSLGRTEEVRLRVFDIRGRLVSSLLEGERGPGEHEIQWDGTDRLGRPAASGVYFYRLDLPGWSAVKRMTLVR